MNSNALNESLEYLKSKAKSLNCWDVCFSVFENPRFAICSGSGKPNQHHNGDGGLVIHTAEVVKLCVAVNAGDWSLNNTVQSLLAMKPICSPRQVFLAAFFHDVGKMWDYQKVKIHDEMKWTGTEHKRNIHHVSRSAITWQQCVDEVNSFDLEFAGEPRYSQEFVDEILHAILAHHGLREWGSPVAPNSKLAWMLHLCDGLSARLDDCDKFDHIKE